MLRQSPLFLKKINDTVERILHVPGNAVDSVLEMAVVIDRNLSKEEVTSYLPLMLRSLKMHSEIFRNVRLNVVYWGGDDDTTCSVSPMSMVMMDSYYEDYRQKKTTKTFETLAGYLKMFQARSKILILLTDGSYQVAHEELLEQVMQPFLEKRLMQVIVDGEDADIRYRFLRTV